jgi:ornithine decarboxylase
MRNRVLYDFISENDFEKIKTFSKTKKTPFLLIDLNKIKEKLISIKESFPFSKVYYAVKANPHIEILKLLDSLDSNFDIASIYELNSLLDLKVSPDRISFGNTIKKEEDIKYAYEKGIRLFSTDSISDLRKLAASAPGSNVFFRMINEGGDADWPLSRKFGTHPDMIYHLALESKKLGLIPYGLSFHVGSQQRDIGQWDNAISQCKYLFDSLKEEGIYLKSINMGGGFPANYLKPTSDIATYATEITRFLKEDFEDHLPEIVIEPGRFLVADAGVIVSDIILISKKSVLNQCPWVYLDVGVYNGLFDSIDELMKFPIFHERQINPVETKEVILAGPTCDSIDILYEDFKYYLPIDIKEGEKIFIFTTGSYTASLSSVGFNGFPPLATYILE